MEQILEFLNDNEKVAAILRAAADFVEKEGSLSFEDKLARLNQQKLVAQEEVRGLADSFVDLIWQWSENKLREQDSKKSIKSFYEKNPQFASLFKDLGLS